MKISQSQHVTSSQRATSSRSQSYCATSSVGEGHPFNFYSHSISMLTPVLLGVAPLPPVDTLPQADGDGLDSLKIYAQSLTVTPSIGE